MKKLFALLLALGLLCSFAMAEEAEYVELSWDAVSDEVKAAGSLQELQVTDDLSILFWVPENMAEQDVSEISEDIRPDAAYATEGEEYTISVYVMDTNWQEYLVNLGATEETVKRVVTNSIDAISFEYEAEGIDMLIIPVSENSVIIFAFTPLNGDEDWDAVKGAIVASIQAAE